MALARPVALLAAAALAGPGCSWAFVRPAPRPRATAPLTCSTSRDAPVADASIAGFLWGTTVMLLSCPGKQCRSDLAWSAVAATAVLGVPAMLSATYGFTQARRCGEAQVLRERWREAAADPLAGTADHPCRPPEAPPCNAGLACHAEQCVTPDAAGGEDQPCLRLPGTSVQMCRAGLSCARGRCVRVDE